MTIEVAALVLALAAIAAVLFHTLRLGDPPTPTSPRVVAAIIRALPALEPGTVYELGAGWGNLAHALAARYPHRQVRGIEASPLPWAMSRIWTWRAPNLALRRGDFMASPLGDAALVVCYAQAATLARLRPKLERELPPGAWVLTHTFQIPGWTPAETHRASDLYRTPIYLYEIGEG